ncbi:MAG: hypothetical protein AB8H86_05970 [Polyangiales bacterium]
MHRVLLLLISALVFGSGGSVSAQEAAESSGPSEEDLAELDEAARLLFENGTRAFDAGRFAEALDRFTTAHRLSGRGILLYNIAISHDRLDQRAEAAEFYERFVEEVPDAAAVGVSRSRAAILRASLADDGDPEEELSGDAPEDTEHAGESSRSLGAPIASFAVAGAGLVTFAVAGVIAGSNFRDAEDACAAGPCDPGFNTAALVADIGLGVAIAGAAIGVILLLTGRDDDNAEGRAELRPLVGARSGGLHLRGSF